MVRREKHLVRGAFLCIFAEVFSKVLRYIVRKPIGRDYKHRGY